MKRNTEATKEKKTDYSIWLYPSFVRRVDSWVEEDNCASRSEFVEKALRFYMGHLASEDVTDYLSDAIVAVIRGSIEDSLHRLGRMVFKWCVELNVALRTVAAIFRGEYVDPEELRDAAETDVLVTNGQIDFRRALDVQQPEGEEDWQD